MCAINFSDAGQSSLNASLPIEMIQDVFLMDFVYRSKILSEEEYASFQTWNAALQASGKTLQEELIVRTIFSASSLRTLDMISKGFLTETSAEVLFSPGGLDRLRKDLQPESFEVKTQKLSRIDIDVCDRAKATDYSQTTKFGPGRGTLVDITLNAATPKVAQSADPNAKPIVLQAGATLGKCLLTSQIGKGGYGVVFAALHQTLGIPVAVKVLLSGSDVPDPEHVRQLRMEAQLLARINHPNIIRVLDFDDAPLPYVILEHVEGPSLANLIATTGSIWCQRACGIFAQVSLGLKAAWDAGIVHRDIKPGNILLTKTGDAKIADLGLAMSPFHSTLKSNSNSPIGTCAYMAPEQARTSHDVDFRADIYSLGATFYHAVTGQLPFTARSAREMLLMHQNEKPISACVRAPQLVDAGTSATIDRMMEKDPARRFDSYDELYDALNQLANRNSSVSDVDLEQAVRELESGSDTLTETRKRSLLRRIFQLGSETR
jgi:eukaryotic-like serine/threonine-protein kinase